MEITCVNAADRFDNVDFDNSYLNGMARSIYPVYTCPHCGERIGFQKQSFENSRRQHHTNLSSNIARTFDEFTRD